MGEGSRDAHHWQPYGDSWDPASTDAEGQDGCWEGGNVELFEIQAGNAAGFQPSSPDIVTFLPLLGAGVRGRPLCQHAPLSAAVRC